MKVVVLGYKVVAIHCSPSIRMLRLGLVIFALVPGAMSYGNLLGYWSLDETTGQALDSSGNGRNSAYVGTSVTRGVPGISGTAYQFAGTSTGIEGEVDFGTGLSLSSVTLNQAIDLTNSLTLSLWVKVASEGGAGTHDVNGAVWLGNPTVASEYATVGIAQTTGPLPASVGGPTLANGGAFGTSRSGGQFRVLGNNLSFADGEWHHIALTIQSGAFAKLYADGGLVSEVNGSNAIATLPATLDKLAFGRFADSTPTGYLKGALDEVRIYDEALSALEVFELYAPLAGITMGDADGDNDVDIDDFYYISDRLFIHESQTVIPGSMGDITRDGSVDFDDFGMWKDLVAPEIAALVFGTQVPEPASVLVVSLASVGLLMWRRSAAR